MTIPKPKHLGPEYADQFKDQSVADAYVNYPPYTAEVFEVLESLIGGLGDDEPRIVLDIGCGTGTSTLARRTAWTLDVGQGTCPHRKLRGPVPPVAAFVERVDAVDQSAAMIDIGRARDGGDRPNIRWVCQSAEDF